MTGTDLTEGVDATAEPTWRTGSTDPAFGAYLGLMDVATHHPSRCAGRPCVVHNPSDHHMRDWPTVYRAEKGSTERTCPHGVGHPDPDDAAYQASIGRGWTTNHGCDGCCEPRKDHA